MADMFRFIDHDDDKAFWKRISMRVDGCRTPFCWELKDGEDGHIYLDRKRVDTGTGGSRGRYVQIRRLLFLISWGIVLPGRKITMRCGNVRCVNPAHARMKGVPAEYSRVQLLINQKWLTEEQAKEWYAEVPQQEKFRSYKAVEAVNE